MLASIASMIMLVGPLYQVSSPLIKELKSIRISEKEIRSLQIEIEEAEEGLVVYRRNSETRLGWRGKIGEMEARLDMGRQRLNELESEVTGIPWLRWSPIFLQAFSLLLFQLANILAISNIAKNISNPGIQTGYDGKGFGNKDSKEEILEGLTHLDQPFDGLVRALQKILKTKLETSGLSQAEFCRQNNIHPRDVSLLFHYFRNKSHGKRVVSRHVLENMKGLLLGGNSSGNQNIGEGYERN